MRLARLAGLVMAVTALAGSAAESVGPSASWPDSLSSGDFTVRYRPEARRAAQRILEVASSRGAAVAARAGLSELGPVEIFVASTDQEFRALTYGGVPDWGAGCAYPDRGVIVLRNPLSVPDPLGMEDVVVHEVAHVAAGRVLGGVRVPRWFHEGIAMTLAGEWRLPRSASLVGAGAGGALIGLERLSASFPEEGRAAMLAYSESFYALRFLMESAGGATPQDVLAAIAEAGNFDDGLARLYGAPRAAFERDAVRSFGSRFGWGILLTRWNVLFVLLTLVLVVGWAVKVRRARVRMREWEEEERRTGLRTRARRPDRSSGWS